ncbi:MAG: hypothetical protein HOV83_18025, partial [Catenulispora sp.]|nr:hypothetical protein [Catenulispora sp.]
MSIRTVRVAGSSYRQPGRVSWWTGSDLVLGTLTVGAVAGVALAGQPVWTRLAAAWWVAFALALARFDVRTHRLPLPLIAAMSAGTCLLLAVQDPGRLGRAAAAGGVLAVGLFLLCLPRRGIGLGDAVLGFPIGVALGWSGW